MWRCAIAFPVRTAASSQRIIYDGGRDALRSARRASCSPDVLPWPELHKSVAPGTRVCSTGWFIGLRGIPHCAMTAATTQHDLLRLSRPSDRRASNTLRRAAEPISSLGQLPVPHISFCIASLLHSTSFPRFDSTLRSTPTDMQFKAALLTLASVAAVAVAAPNEFKRQNADVSPTLTTHFTTQTFTATKVLQSFITVEPWVKTITKEETWTVAHTVTRAVPTGKPPRK